MRISYRKINKTACGLGLAAVLLLLTAFKTADDTARLIDWTNRYLTEAFDPGSETKLKKWELALSPDLFIRLRKTYTNGRQEYYSFKLDKFKDIDYLGTASGGTLQLETYNDDIISQTYNDPKGDVDDMVSTLPLPVKNTRPERLDSLRNALLQLKDAMLAAEK